MYIFPVQTHPKNPSTISSVVKNNGELNHIFLFLAKVKKNIIESVGELEYNIYEALSKCILYGYLKYCNKTK